MTDGTNSATEVRIGEISAHHVDLVTRMTRIDPVLARRAMAAVVGADPEMTLAQACGERAMILRADFENLPWRGDASLGGMGGGDLRPAIAITLDLMAGRYPATARFRPRFRFSLASKPEAAGVLAVMAWEFEKVFTTPAGRMRDGYSEDVVSKIAIAMARPQAGEFFDLIRTDTAMAALGTQMYCGMTGEDPTPRLNAIYKPHHPDAVARTQDAVAKALALIEVVAPDADMGSDMGLAPV